MNERYESKPVVTTNTLKLSNMNDPKEPGNTHSIQHRINSESKGFSLRKLPKANLDDIIKACQHYLKKGSGTYNSVSGRYLYQACNEIQKMAEKAKVEYDYKLSRQSKSLGRYKRIVKEWEECFGNEFVGELVHSFLTPKEVFEKLENQRRKIRELEHHAKESAVELDQVRKMHQQALTDQHRASRQAMRKNFESVNSKVMRMQAMNQQEFQRTIEDKNKLINLLSDEVESLKRETIPDLKNTIEEYNHYVRDMKRELGDLRNTLTQSCGVLANGINGHTSERNLKDELLRQRLFIKQMQQEHEEQLKKHRDMIVNLQKQNAKSLHQSGLFNELIHDLQRARHMNEFYTLKKRCEKLAMKTSSMASHFHVEKKIHPTDPMIRQPEFRMGKSDGTFHEPKLSQTPKRNSDTIPKQKKSHPLSPEYQDKQRKEALQLFEKVKKNRNWKDKTYMAG